MTLRIGLGIVAVIMFVVCLWSWRLPRRWWSLIIRVVTGIVAVAALVVDLSLPTQLTLHHMARVPGTTQIYYISEDINYTSASGYSPPHGVILHAVRGTDGGEIWHRDLPDRSSALLYRGEVLVVTSGERTSTLLALAESNGSVRWQISDLPPLIQIALDGATIYVHHIDANRHTLIAAYSLDTHQPLWAKPVQVSLTGDVMARSGSIFVYGHSSLDENLEMVMALRGTTGEMIWQQQQRDDFTVSPSLDAIISDHALLIKVHNSMRAYDPQSGQIFWSVTLPKGEFIWHIASAGIVITKDTLGNLSAWNAITGALVWQRAATGLPHINDAVVYVTTGEPGQIDTWHLTAFDLQTGTERWRSPISDAEFYWTVGTEVLASSDTSRTDGALRTLWLLDSNDGHEIQRLAASTNDQFTYPSVRAANVLFIGAEERPYSCYSCAGSGELFAYDLDTGALAWQLHATWLEPYTLIYLLDPDVMYG